MGHRHTGSEPPVRLLGMRAWTSPVVPRLGVGTAGPVRLHDTSTDAARSFTSFLPNFVRNQITRRPVVEEERISA